MRKFKIAVWILLLYILRTVFAGVIAFNGTVPDLLLVFAVIFAFHEWESGISIPVIILCGVLSGSEAGRIFPADVIIISAAGLASRELFKSMKLVPGTVKIFSVIIIASLALSSFECVAVYKGLSVHSLVYNILPYVIYTALAACIMYPLIKKTLFRTSEKQLII